MVEPLEARRVLALLGVSTIAFPRVEYDSNGVLTYDPLTQALKVDATPLTYRHSLASSSFAIGTPRDFDISIRVDNSGNLLGGVPGDDFVVIGEVDANGDSIVDYSGVLLTGEIAAVGHSNLGPLPGDTDFFDFRFTPTGGALFVAGFYTNKDIGVSLTSEHSTFADDFTLPFTGGAKGRFAPTDKPGQQQPPVDARITITPDDTNEVGQPHMFTTVVEVNDNLLANAPGGDTVTGFRPATDTEVQTVTVTLTGQNGANPAISNPLDPESDEVVSSPDNNFNVTFVSPTAGTVIGTATATVIVNGQSIPAVSTNGTNGSSGPATKTYVDASITITPDDTNEVGQPHTFTVTVMENAGNGAGFVAAAGESVTVNLANINGASTPVTAFTGTTNALGQFQVTVNSPTAGQVVANATGVVVVGGLNLTRDTDPATASIGAGPGGSGPAVKTYVDARITITPDDTNEVGQPHTFTVTVMENAGNGAGFVAAGGESVTVSLANINGASTPTTTFTGTTDAAGQFQVTFASPTAGQVIGNATGSIIVGGLTLTRDTDPATANIGSGPGGSGPANKTFVDARIVITPDATNEVGDDHTFTVTVLEDAGNGAGFVPAAGETITVNLANTNGASTPTTSFTGTTNAAGQFQVTFASATAGQVIGNATGNINVGGLTLTRDTDPSTATIGAGPGGSGPATKTYVDAKITITPNATNEVGQPHTFTVTVLEDAGNGAGFVPAANESVTVSLANTNGASTPTTTFTGTTNASGQFQVTFASSTAGQVIGNATGTILVGGLTLTRDTDPSTATIGAGPGGSGPATKTFVDAKISITPNATNEVGQPHTFTVTVLEDAGNGAGFVPAANESVTVSLANTNGASTPTTTFTGTTNASGQFQVTFASSTAGQVIGNATGTVLVGGLTLTRDTNPATANIGAGPGGSGPATKRFVDARIILSPLTATNPTNDPHVITASVQQDDGLTAAQGGDGVTGFAPAPNGTSVAFSLVNSGGATAVFVGGSTATVSGGVASVTINSPTAGTVTLNGTTTFLVGGNSLTRDTNPLTAPLAGPGGSGPATKIYVTPGIDIEKTTDGATNSNPTDSDYDNEDAPNGPGVPVLTPGSTVTWTYKVTNTGGVAFAFNQVVIVDDNGTPGDTADDLSTTDGDITFSSVQTGDADNILEPGEVWLYQASGIVQTLAAPVAGGPIVFNMEGNSSLDGPNGNIRTFTAGGISVRASAFSRDKDDGSWSTAYLGSYGGGLGVTDDSEGTGANDTHTVDNVGRDNYVLFEFSQSVVVDAAYLGYVVNDSDLTVWIGTIPGAFSSSVTLSDAVLTSLGFTEVNLTDLTSARLADLNAGNISGNVLVIAAQTTDATPEDRFKIELLKVRKTTPGIYENKAVVTVPGDTDSDDSHYKNPNAPPPAPSIDIEKTTNGSTNSNPTAPNYDNEDSADGVGVPALTPGSVVTWTYQVTNTGNVPFAFNEVVIVDDNGTPTSAGDDLSTTGGQITFLSVQSGDADNILEPSEVWLYKATGTVKTLSGGTTGSAVTFDMEGNSYLDGSNGNIRTFSAGGISVNASAFSRDKANGAWSTAWLGSYGGGLGVTDSSEGDGSSDMHTVDNVGRDNYVLFEFSESVVVDAAFLGYVVGDSDLTVWIGTLPNAFNSHQTLSDAVLTSLGFKEVNLTTLTGSRWADLNAGNLSGNVLVIAADTDDDTPDDRFKIELLKVRESTPGIYENKAVVTVPGDTDSDKSHYKNSNTPAPVPGTIKGKKWADQTGNGLSSDDVPLGGTTVYLDADNDGVKDAGEPSTVTAADGSYQFTGLAPATYIVREIVPSGAVRTFPELSNKYVVNLAAGATASGKDFANFQHDDCEIQNVYYTINRDGCITTVSSLAGNTEQGDIITVTFTVPTGHGVEQLSFMSYTAPDPYFDASRASLQRIYEAQTGFFLPGTHTMTIEVPCSYYQVDFVCGPIIDELGPAGSNIFYTPQGRLLGADNDGDNSGTANPSPGVTLVVGGGSGNDDIRYNVASDSSKMSVMINGQEAGQVSFGSGSGVTITRLSADGNAGADYIKVAEAIGIDALLRGGSGNDTLVGGAGDDILLGESGDDKLYGYLGRDLMIGGINKDNIYGNAQDDILIGGTTAHDENLIALDAIMREWTRPEDSSGSIISNYSTRISRLRGLSSGGWNGSYRLDCEGSNRTVFDDNASDTLYGEAGKDWFLADTAADGGSNNDVVSSTSGEVITDID